MKKGHYIKQDADELLTGEISNEDCAVFKAYYQLKAMCFKKELKDSYMTFKQAERVYDKEVINVLIDEEYVFRIIEDGLDYLLIPSITDNVKGMTDYSLQNSIIGKISGVKKKLKLKILNELGDNTDELELELKELQLRLIDVKDVVNERSNVRLTIKNKIKQNNIKEDNTNLNNLISNNTKQLNISEEQAELIKRERGDK